MAAPASAYELQVDILATDIDEVGHVNNVTYVRWVQEAAVAHWEAEAAAADQAALFWVVVRHEIDYRREALPGDRVVARTWVGAATRLKFERHTEIVREADGALLARAVTIWCPMDSATRRPVAVSAEVRARFSNNAG
jgi:acyl-CoA thioester hydrolase